MHWISKKSDFFFSFLLVMMLLRDTERQPNKRLDSLLKGKMFVSMKKIWEQHIRWSLLGQK